MEYKPDPLDTAVDAQIADTERAIQTIRDRAKRTLMHTGYCFNCAEPVHSPHLYCDLDCRDDYEERLQRLRRLGK